MEKYRRRVLSRGETHIDRVVSEMKDAFKTHLDESPSSHMALIKNKEYRVMLGDRRFADEQLNGKYLFTEWEHKFMAGDYVDVLDTKWIIDLVEEEPVQTKRGYRLLPCNNILKWRDNQGRIYEYPCNISDKTSVFSDGLIKGSYITTTAYQARVIVPHNRITEMIHSNDRFIFNHSVHSIYYVTRIDTITTNGLMYIIMKRDELRQSDDDLENNLSKPVGVNAQENENIITPDIEDDGLVYYVPEIIGQTKINIRESKVEYSVPKFPVSNWELIGNIATMEIIGDKVYITPKGTYGDIILKATTENEVLEKTINIGFI